MIAIEVGIIDLAIAIEIGVCALDWLACLWVVELMIYIEHVWLVTLGKYLELICVDARTYLHIGLVATLDEREVLHLHVLPSEVVAQVPLPVLGLDRSRIQGQLDTLAIHITHVGQDSLREVGTGCGRNGSQEVLGLTGIEIERTTEATAQESEIDTEVPRGGGLPLQVLHVCLRTVSHDVVAIDESLGTCHTGGIDWQVVVVADTILLTCHTIAGTELQVADHLAVLQPRLLCQGPAQGYRWESTPAVILGEAGRSISTNCSRQEVLSIK